VLEALLPTIMAAVGFLVGAFSVAFRFVSRHRKLIAKVWDWAIDATKDGKLSKEELGHLFIIVGSYLEEEDKREFDRIQLS
jgi:hypothetical protein